MGYADVTVVVEAVIQDQGICGWLLLFNNFNTYLFIPGWQGMHGGQRRTLLPPRGSQGSN